MRYRESGGKSRYTAGMAKKTRKRKLAKRKEQKRKRGSSRKLRPWEAVKMKMYRMPEIFPPDIPKEERLELVRVAATKAGEKFKEKYAELEKWFEDFDSLYILSFCSMYFLSSPDGIDPEAEGHMDFPPYLLEVMQALALTKDRADSAQPLLERAEELQEAVKELSSLLVLRDFASITDAETDEDRDERRLQSEMRGNTLAVRNWAYYHQMKRVTLDLAASIDADFKTKYGIGSAAFMDVLFRMTEARNDKLNDHISKIRPLYRMKDHTEMMQAYNAAFSENPPIEEGDFDALWDRANKDIQQLFAMIVCHSDLKLAKDVYSFDISYAEALLGDASSNAALSALFDELSLSFGDLKSHNKEHFLLDNPVTRQPFVHMEDGSYFSAIWAALPHYALDILENLIATHEDLKKKYTSEKAKYLEREVERIVGESFPNGQIYSGSQWRDPATGTLYENDVLLLIDSFALVIEAKSETVTEPAKRGAAKRLRETLQRLIEAPSEQALRFIDFLRANPGPHTFATKRGVENNVDTTNTKYYIPLGVTFSHLGMIGSNLKKLIESGVVHKRLEELAPSMTFTDLEVLLEILESEAERIHYLGRRREIEAHLEYQGDEMDLLAFYLDHGFNIGEAEYSQNASYNIALKSKELDPYIIGTNEGVNVKKPRLPMTKWWRDMLSQIQNRQIEGWMETCYVLLNSTKDDQRKFQSAIRKLAGAISRGRTKKPHNWALFLSGPGRRRYAIVGYPYTTSDKELRNAIMAEALNEADVNGTRGSVVIGINLKREDYPYSVLARRLSTDLFDTLTLPPRKDSANDDPPPGKPTESE